MEGSVAGKEDDNRNNSGNRDEGSGYKWCECMGGRRLVESLVPEFREE